MNELFVIVELLDDGSDYYIRESSIKVYGNSKGKPFTKGIDARRALTMRKLSNAYVKKLWK